MQKVLKKRIPREFRENRMRYFALSLLIIFGMYVVISMAGSALTIIKGSKHSDKQNRIEDGEFGVFVPLSKEEENKLTQKGLELERMFYLDFNLDDNSTLRVFQNRRNINLIALDEGSLAEKENEVVLEKRYCEEHNLKTGQEIQLAGKTFEITGICTTPDYNSPLKNFTDSTVGSKAFGTAFVIEKCYDQLLEEGLSVKAEEYQYAYQLNGKMTNEGLKNELQNLEFTSDEVEDPYFQDYWEETGGKKQQLEDGINDLDEGTIELNDGLKELNKHNDGLNEGAESIFDSYLKQANEGLTGLGITLTEENFEEALQGLIDKNPGNSSLRMQLRAVKMQLGELKKYKDGVADYTKGVAEAGEGSEEISDGVNELSENTDEILEKGFDIDISNLTFFMKAEDNPRINAAADDQLINLVTSLIAGIIVMILFTYVISVFVIHGIEKESTVIGALYALGANKKDLMLHYLMLPVLVTFLSSIIGTVAGFSRWGMDVQMMTMYAYFSIPGLKPEYPVCLIIYGILMPAVVAIVVNCLVIQKKLSQPVLALLHGQKNVKKISNIDLGKMSFLSRFRLRQMLREIRTSFTVLFGLFISLLIMMMGIDCYVLCQNISRENKEDTKFSYMYTYKYPEKEVPDGGEAAFSKSLKKEIMGYDFDITLLGIEKDNSFFDAKVEKGRNQVIISSALAQKYKLSIGDMLVLRDEEEEENYAFEITGVTQYSPSFYAFMDIESMRELFGQSDDYYNVVFSDHELSINSGRLYATTSKEDIEKASDVFIALMMSMIYLLCGASALIFCMVMYLMMKVMIDRSAYSISLVKIFGYRDHEIRKLYLSGNFILIAIGAAICVPLSKLCVDQLFPGMISNAACGMNLTFTWQLYAGIYMVIIIQYLLINKLLAFRLKKFVPADVLKNRE